MIKLGQLLMFGIEGTKLSSETAKLLNETGCGGVILFKRNIADPKQIRSFVDELNVAVSVPLIVGVDQEGGRVARLLAPFTKIPPMSKLGNLPDGEELAKKVGGILGKELAAVGFNIDFAPVLDVLTNVFNPVIGDRSFSADPNIVKCLGTAFISGIQAENVAACAKHFPGHGDTDVDSHKGLPLLNHTRARFDACEFLPFKAAIDDGVASIMTAHLRVPNLDDSLPITISRRVTTGILRKEMGFDGVVFTDDLRMKGILDTWPPGEAAWRAIGAGADVALVCHEEKDQRAAFEGLKRAVGEGWIDESQIARSLARVAGFKARFCCAGARRPKLDVIGCKEHEKIVKEI